MEKLSSTSNCRYDRNNCTQTEIPISTDGFCQVPQKQGKQIQTDAIENNQEVFAEFDLSTLRAFLQRVTPLVCSVLEKNIKSKAFDRYQVLSHTDVASITRMHLLEKPLEPEFCCSSISWNSVGTAIAAAYSSINHKNWCEHTSSVDLWSLSRKDFDPKKPNLTLETDCCVSYVSFHPQLPAIIVAGKLNGEILLWDISKEDDSLLASTEAAAFNHREPITGMHWILQYGKSDKIEFASSSLDGKVLIWKLENRTLKLTDGFIILAKELPRNFPIKANKDNAEVGITSMSINAEDRSIFVIGTEGGGIFQCSFDSLIPAPYSGYSPVTLKSPINMVFERHKGQVMTVEFSLFSRNVFLSAGSEGELRIYSLLQLKPLMTLQLTSGGINAAQWSPIRPLVLSCVCDNGQFHVWDLVVSEKAPIESNPLTIEKSHSVTLKNNKENASLLATSSSDGTIQVWELSGTLLQSRNGELQQLQALSKNID